MPCRGYPQTPAMDKHACWHEPFMTRLRDDGLLTPGRTLPDSRLVAVFSEPEVEASRDNADFTVFKAAEALTKGMEVNLPACRSKPAGWHRGA